MKITIYGTGCCSNCEILYQNTLKAVSEIGLKADIIKETDMEKIIAANLMNLPAIAINEKVLAQGKKLSVEDIKKILNR